MSGPSIQDLGRIGQELLRPDAANGARHPDNVAGSSFGDALESALHSVDDGLKTADKTATNYISGKGGDLHGVMIEMEKADLQFRTMMQIRNKLLEAYKEVMRMPV